MFTRSQMSTLNFLSPSSPYIRNMKAEKCKRVIDATTYGEISKLHVPSTGLACTANWDRYVWRLGDCCDSANDER